MLSDMRWVVFPIMVVAAIALSSTACRNEQIPDTPQESVHRITVQASHADTRTAVVADGQGYKPTWMEGDWIHLFEFFEGGVNWGESKELGSTQASVTSFDVLFKENAPQGPIQYVGAYSPNVDIASVNDENLGDSWAQAWGNNSPVPSWWLFGYIPENQHPRLESFDPDADVMFSQMIESQTRPESINLAFARVGSIAKITLKDLPAGERVLWGYLTVGPSWKPWGGLVYDYTKGKIAILPPESDGHDTDGILPDEMINFLFDRDVVPVVGNDGNAVIWMRVLSGELSDHFSVTVYTEDSSGQEHEYVKEVDLVSRGRSIVFEEGGITEFTVGMEAVDPGTIHDHITFSEETLMFFPELENEQPIVRIPKDFGGDNNAGFRFPFFFEGKDEWTVSCSFNEDDVPWLEVIEEDYGVYLQASSHYLYTQTATLICSNPDMPSPIEIPVVGFNIVTMKRDGEVYNWHYETDLMTGQSTTISADIQLPGWMHLNDTSPFVWECGQWGVDITEEEGNTCHLVGLPFDDEYVDEWLFFSLYFEHDLDIDVSDHFTYHCYFYVEPLHLPLICNGKDMNEGILYCSPNEQYTFTADLSSIPESDKASLQWFLNDVGSDAIHPLTPDPATPYSVDFMKTDYGAYALVYFVESGGKMYTSYCDISVSPIKMNVNGEILPGWSDLTLALGQEVELTATFDEGQQLSGVSWSISCGDFDDDWQYVYGTGDITRLFSTSNPYTVRMKAVNYGQDQLYLVTSENETAYYFNISVRPSSSVPAPAPTKISRRKKSQVPLPSHFPLQEIVKVLRPS